MKKIFRVIVATVLIASIMLGVLPRETTQASIVLPSQDLGIGREVPSMRTEYSTTVQIGEDRYSATFSQSPLYTQSAIGTWEDYVLSEAEDYYQIQHPFTSVRFYDDYMEVWDPTFTELLSTESWVVEYALDPECDTCWVPTSYSSIERSKKVSTEGVEYTRIGKTELGQRIDTYWFGNGKPVKITIEQEVDTDQVLRFVWVNENIPAATESPIFANPEEDQSGIKFLDSSETRVGEIRWNDALDISSDIKIETSTSSPGHFTTNIIFERFPTVAGASAVLDPTMTFYPDAHPEGTSVDGRLARFAVDSAAGETWASIRESTGTSVLDNHTTGSVVLRRSSDLAGWYYLTRFGMLFDTSEIPDNAIINSGIISIYGTAKTQTGAYAPSINVYSFDPASDTELVDADYEFANFGTTQLSNTIAYAAWNVAGYNTFVLNASGEALINKLGISRYSLREVGADVADAEQGAVGFATSTGFQFYASEEGPGFQPRLVVDYTPIGDAPPGTFYPDAGVNSVDGWASTNQTNDTWANIRTKAGIDANDSQNFGYVHAIDSGAGANQWDSMNRAIFTFDTSSIDDDAIIEAAIFSFYGKGKADNLVCTPEINIYPSNPLVNNAVSIADYNIARWADTTEYSTTLGYAAWSIVGYNDFTLNAAGKDAISLTGITKLGVRDVEFDVGGATPNWIANNASLLSIYWTEEGAGKQPKLVVTFSVGGSTSLVTYSVNATTSVSATGNAEILTVGGNITEIGFQIMEDPFPATTLAFAPGAWGDYDETGILMQTGPDTLLQFAREGDTHASDDGVIVRREYTISTNTWGSATQIYSESGVDPRNLGGGVIGSRIILFFYRSGAPAPFENTAYITSSDLTGTSWGSSTQIAAGGFLLMSPHGRIVETDDPQTFLQPVYGNTAGVWGEPGATYATSVLRSTDSGVTWAVWGSIYSGAVWNNETAIAYIEGGKLIAVNRCEYCETSLKQSQSDDNGATWTTPLPSNLPAPTGGKIPDIIYDPVSEDALVVYSNRMGDGTTKYVQTDADQVFSDNQTWLTPHIIFNNTGIPTGYHSTVKISNTKYLTTYTRMYHPAGGNQEGEIWQFMIPRNYTETGVFSSSTFSANFTDLEPGRTYYVRAFTYGSQGWEYANIQTFTTLTPGQPTVATTPAAQISTTTATLQGTVTDLGTASSVYGFFEYGTTVSLDLTTPETAELTAVGGFSLGVVNLLPSTQYFFRAVIRYDTNSFAYSDSIMSFTTTTSGTIPGAPVNFSAISTTEDVNLSWTRGTGATNTLVRYSTDTYPATTTSGAQLYFSTGTSVTHSDLSSGVTYYYSAWSETGGLYSVSHAMTTGGLGTPSEPGEIPYPDTIQIEDVRVFEGTGEEGSFESGSILILIAYRLMYDVTPAEDVRDYFVFQMMDGEVLRTQTTPDSWGYRPASIFQSSTHSLTWGFEYTMYLTGRANKWNAPVPAASYSMTPGVWVGNDMTELDSWVLNTAERIESYYGTELLKYVPAHGRVLNDTGGQIFEEAIPGLRDVRPHLFATGAEAIVVDTAPRDMTYADNLTATVQLGTTIMDQFDNLAPHLGLDSGEILGTATWVVICMVALVGLIAMTGSFLLGVVVSLPLMFAGTYLGLIPMQFVVIFAALGFLLAFWKVVSQTT